MAPLHPLAGRAPTVCTPTRRTPTQPRSSSREADRERGSGSILAVAIMAAMFCLVSIFTPLYVVLSAKQQAAGAADAAALAAADVAVGIVAGVPCAAAASVAAANGASVTACEVDGAIVTVRVSIPVIGFAVPSTATAGPPGSVTN